jgi:chaperone modulatory protein CbpM
MFDDIEFCSQLGVPQTALSVWIEEGWIRPESSAGVWRFSAVDLARGRLIVDLRGAMGVNDEGVAVILHLVDQLHGLRSALRGVATAQAAPKGPS